jgi:hypothetical protein
LRFLDTCHYGQPPPLLLILIAFLKPPVRLALAVAEFGKCPLILAAQCGLLSVAAALLAAGCDENRCDGDGFNAGFWAKSCGHAGFFDLAGAPGIAKPAVEEVVTELGIRRMALVAVGAKIKPVKRSKKKAKAKGKR